MAVGRIPSPLTRRPADPARTVGRWLLLLALVWAPLAGHLHGVLHGQGAVVRMHSDVAEPRAAGPSLRHGLLALFGDHHDAPSCRLYDGAAGGDAACGLAPAALLAAVPAVPSTGADPRPASRAPLTVRARGPPRPS